MLQTQQQMTEEHLKVIGQQIQTAIKGLIDGQRGKPFKPVDLNKIIDLAAIMPLIQMTEQIDSDNFFIGKLRFEVAPALIFQRTIIIVDLADKQINLNELVFHKQKNLIILCLSVSSLLFLLLIHIKYNFRVFTF